MNGSIKVMTKVDAGDLYLVVRENPEYMIAISAKGELCIVYSSNDQIKKLFAQKKNTTLKKKNAV